MKLKVQGFFLVLISSLACFAQAQDKRSNDIDGEQSLHSKLLAESNAIHKDRKGIKYKERYDIQIDLSKLESVEQYSDHTKMPLELSIEQRDEVYSQLSAQLPAGTDFAVWVTRFKENNVASAIVALPKNAADVSFEGVDLVLSSGAVKHDGFYLGAQDVEPHYSLRGGWTKERGLNAIAIELNSGASSDVETTIFFRDKHDFKLKQDNPYREVMTHLLDGDPNGYAHVEGHTDQASFSLNVRPDQIEYIRVHPLVSNVVPNLPLID